jgi:hypothetical protein
MNIDTNIIKAGARSAESGPEIHTRKELDRFAAQVPELATLVGELAGQGEWHVTAFGEVNHKPEDPASEAMDSRQISITFRSPRRVMHAAGWLTLTDWGVIRWRPTITGKSAGSDSIVEGMAVASAIFLMWPCAKDAATAERLIHS